jgi:hypothetical protein
MWSKAPEASKLKELFSQYRADTLSGGGGRELICQKFGRRPADYEELARGSAYATAYTYLDQMRRRIDQISDRQSGNPTAQSRQALALLKSYRKENRFEDIQVCSDLIRGALLPTWGPAERREFDEGAAFLQEFVDYFLSYSNRNAELINGRFRRAFSRSTRDLVRELETKVNLVALQIVGLLKNDNGLAGFYDADQVKLGDAIKDSIFAGAGSAIVFVQLVVRPMLIKPTSEENWCFREYRVYDGDEVLPGAKALGRPRSYAFLIGEELPPGSVRPAEAVRPAILHSDYEPWYDRMSELKVMTLDPSHTARLRRQIEQLAGEIRDFRDEVLDWVVAEQFVFDD